MKVLIFALIGLVSILGWGCGDTSAPAAPKVNQNNNSFIVTGGNYQNSLFNSTTLTRDTCAFYNSSGLTKGVVEWHNGKAFVSMAIQFPGRKTGTFNMGPSYTNADTDCVNITHTDVSNGGNAVFESIFGTLTISQYDPVNGKIKGTFSGTFVDANNQYFDITKGNFSAVHGNDR